MKNILLIFLALLIFPSCGHKEKNYAATDAVKFAAPVVKDAEISMPKKSEAPPPESPGMDTSKKIIKEGEISFEVGNLKTTRSKILHSLKMLGGYIAEESETSNGDNNSPEYEMKIRIPSKNFDFLLDSVSSNADKIDSKNVKLEDVTTQYIDIKTQLANQKILENTYLGLLKKTNKMNEVLQIESKLTDIRTAIDSTQGALNYLNKQVAYSSLAVTFYTKTLQQDNGLGLGYKFKSAISGGWGLLQDLFFGLITLWPVILLIVVLYVLVKRWRKRRKLKIKQ